MSDSEENSQSQIEEFMEESETEGEITINIEYDILESVSRQLYRNPRRAIEELVCNSYDAAASQCYLSTPKDEGAPLQVLDNGESMDKGGLKQLWKVAGGPKKQKAENTDLERTISSTTNEVDNRRQIGKFGVGKLAAYALGDRLIHVATKDGITRIVSVKRSKIRQHDIEDPPKVEIKKMEEEEAKEYLGSYLDTIPDPWDQGWDSWTLAIVDEIYEEIKPQYLNRMISTALPREANFKVYKDNEVIEPQDFPDETYSEMENLAEDEEAITDVETHLKKFWVDYEAAYDDEGDVPAEKFSIETEEISPYEDDSTEKAIKVPELGAVVASGKVYKEMLRRKKDRDLNDFGYKVKIRGKLLNKGDPRFGTDEKTYEFWHRFRGEFEMPFLDEDILVQRDQLKENKKSDIARAVMDGFYSVIRSRARREKNRDEESHDPGEYGGRISRRAPLKSGQALQGLTQIQGEGYPEGGWEDVDVQLVQGEANSDAIYYENSSIFINEEHPFFRALKGKGSLSQGAMIAVGEGLTGNILSAGYLSFNDLADEESIEDILKITDNALEAAASYLEDPVKHHRENLQSTSEEGDTPFEKAVRDALDYLSLEVEHLGGSGDSDLIVKIPLTGRSNHKISVEVKGKREGTVDHQKVNISTVKDHMINDGCDEAVVIAREFQLDGNEEENSALLRHVDNEEGMISLLDLDSLVKTLELHADSPFGHERLKEILTNESHPDNLIEMVEDTWNSRPVPEDRFTRVIEAAKEICDEENNEKPHVSMIRERLRGELDLDSEEISTVLEFGNLSSNHIIFTEEKKFKILQEPEEIKRDIYG